MFERILLHDNQISMFFDIHCSCHIVNSEDFCIGSSHHVDDLFVVQVGLSHVMVHLSPHIIVSHVRHGGIGADTNGDTVFDRLFYTFEHGIVDESGILFYRCTYLCYAGIQ
ncbi:hypothetical protein D3C76_1578080 [compost metagenome]